MTEPTLAQIMEMVDPETTRAAIERQRQQALTMLADLKAQYAANAENSTITEAQREQALANDEQALRSWYKIIQQIDARLKSSDAALKESAERLWKPPAERAAPSRAERRRNG